MVVLVVIGGGFDGPGLRLGVLGHQFLVLLQVAAELLPNVLGEQVQFHVVGLVHVFIANLRNDLPSLTAVTFIALSNSLKVNSTEVISRIWL